MLRTIALTTSFAGNTLFEDLDLEISRGALTALTGPSGSGKSTLLNCLGLLSSPTSGRVEFDGRDLTALGSRDARRFRQRELGYLFQNYALIEDATVGENLAVALPGQWGRARRARDRSMDEALQRVGLAVGLGQRVASLSGGEQQRVALARLLLKQPSLVLADEPTGALDEDNTATVVALLRRLADQGACVVIATHDPGVRDACDAHVALAVGSTVPHQPQAVQRLAAAG
jgi:putative ABC transport system ATP-binding protein